MLAEIKDPERREDLSRSIELEEGEFYKFDGNAFQEILADVADNDIDAGIWVGDAGLTDAFYVILRSTSESVYSSGPVAIDLAKLKPGTEKNFFDSFIGRVFPGYTPDIYLINDAD